MFKSGDFKALFTLADVTEFIEILFLHVAITLMNTFFRFRCDQTVSMSPLIYQKVQSNVFSKIYRKLRHRPSSFVKIAVFITKIRLFPNSIQLKIYMELAGSLRMRTKTA